MKTRRHHGRRAGTAVILAAIAITAAIAGGACSDELPSDQTSSTTSSSGGESTSSTSSSGGTGGTMGTGGTGGMGGMPDCVTNPMTHVEIINACTDAQPIDVMPVLPLLGSDGSLPPLP
ncbi:MAG: hypothetical protein QM820_34560 [Minicystis sp.]